MSKRTKEIAKAVTAVVAVCLIALIFMKACGKEDEVEQPYYEPGVNSAATGNTSAPSIEDGEAETQEPQPGDEPLTEDDIEAASIVAPDVGGYANDKVVSHEYYRKGDTISVGVKTDDRTGGIYINPSCSVASKDSPVGFYVMCDAGYILFSQVRDEPTSDYISQSGDSNIMLGRTYDLCSKASFTDGLDYGVKWQSDINESATLYIRAISLDENTFGSIVATVCVDIEYDDKTEQTSISRIYDSDVRDTGELSSDDRTALITDAVDYLTNVDRFRRAITFEIFTEDMWDVATSQAVVEKVPQTYYPKLYDTKGKMIYSRDYRNCDLYAVSMELTGFGHITLYYAPRMQIMGFDTPHTPGSDDAELTLLGYDAFYPFTKESLDDLNFREEE